MGFSRPLTGAWIETAITRCSASRRAGRPLTGAWIETLAGRGCGRPIRVAPSRGRGLKHKLRRRDAAEQKSPPHGGVD